MFERFRFSDITIICGLIALIVFGHILMFRQPAKASGIRPLLAQGSGIAYSTESQPVNQYVNDYEFNARSKLYELGAAQLGYSTYFTHGRYGYLHELVQVGYLKPSDTGSTLVNSYSISFYLPPGRRGFTLIAQPSDFELRPFMITENQNVVLITPAVMSDPNESWQAVREMETNLIYSRGYYDYLNSMMLLNYDPPLQVRLNLEKTDYVLQSLIQHGGSGFTLNDSLVYIASFSTYMLGDTRSIE